MEEGSLLSPRMSRRRVLGVMLSLGEVTDPASQRHLNGYSWEVSVV